MVVQHHTEGGMAEVDNLMWKYTNFLHLVKRDVLMTMHV